MKYIDADLLRKEIEKRLKNIRDYMNGVGIKYKGPKYHKAQGKESAYDALLSIIVSLQQEQPCEDPEAEIQMQWDSFDHHLAEYGDEQEEVVWLNWSSFGYVCKDLYELGKNSK